MLSERKREIDYQRGQLNEERMMPILEKKFNVKLINTPRYATFDFFSDDRSIFIEVKGNNCLSTQYYCCLIGFDKVRASLGKVKEGKKVYLVFSYTDFDFYHEVNPTIDYNQFLKYSGRSDRGYCEYKQYCFLPHDLLKKLNDNIKIKI